MAKRTASESPPKERARKVNAPATPAKLKTRTLPEDQRGAWFEDPDVVTMLQVYGTDTQFELPRDGKTFTLGSGSDLDIVIPDGFLSSLHCVLVRRGIAIRVHDQGSHNGTFFDGRREAAFDLRPGDTFTAGAIRFLALNDEMKAAYPVLADILGSEDEAGLRRSGDLNPSPSDLIVAATSGANILLTGEPHCEQDRLARIIHSISLRRGREIVAIEHVPDDRAEQRAILDRASRSTLVLPIDDQTPVMDATFASMVFSSTFHVRVIAIASTISRATGVLGSHASTMRAIAVRPLAQRGRMLLRLLDRMLGERGSPLRTSALTRENQVALQAYSWPDNVADLRVAADRFVAIATAGSFRKAADALNVSLSSLHYWFSALGLSHPLVVGEAP